MDKPLSVPYHKQRAVGYCLPACVQMVLAYQQVSLSQEEVARQLGLIDGLGAPTRSVQRLAVDNLQVVYEEGTVTRLKAWLDAGIPPVAFVHSSELAYWQGESFQHAVVIIGLQGEIILLLDPDRDKQVIEVPVEEFQLAWLGMDYLYAAIYRER